MTVLTYRWTLERYHQAIEAGVLLGGDRWTP
jgi:hypothetical protein